MIDVSHLVAFLAGSAAGAAGTYLADRFTDQRRRQEGARKDLRKLERLRRLMPDLLAEIHADLVREHAAALRKFLILPNDRLTFNGDRPRFVYFESEHRAVKNQVGILVAEGFASVLREEVNPATPAIYRFEEHFVDLMVRS